MGFIELLAAGLGPAEVMPFQVGRPAAGLSLEDVVRNGHFALLRALVDRLGRERVRAEVDALRLPLAVVRQESLEACGALWQEEDEEDEEDEDGTEDGPFLTWSRLAGEGGAATWSWMMPPLCDIALAERNAVRQQLLAGAAEEGHLALCEQLVATMPSRAKSCTVLWSHAASQWHRAGAARVLKWVHDSVADEADRDLASMVSSDARQIWTAALVALGRHKNGAKDLTAGAHRVLEMSLTRILHALCTEDSEAAAERMPDVLCEAARHGWTSLLRTLQAGDEGGEVFQGFADGTADLAAATVAGAEGGHLDAVEFLARAVMANRGPCITNAWPSLRNDAVVAAAGGGHLRVLEWCAQCWPTAAERRPDPSHVLRLNDAAKVAASTGRTHVLRWLRERCVQGETPFAEEQVLWRAAAAAGQPAVLEMLWQQSQEHDDRSFRAEVLPPPGLYRLLADTFLAGSAAIPAVEWLLHRCEADNMDNASVNPTARECLLRASMRADSCMRRLLLKWLERGAAQDTESARMVHLLREIVREDTDETVRQYHGM